VLAHGPRIESLDTNDTEFIRSALCILQQGVQQHRSDVHRQRQRRERFSFVFRDPDIFIGLLPFNTTKSLLLIFRLYSGRSSSAMRLVRGAVLSPALIGSAEACRLILAVKYTLWILSAGLVAVRRIT